VYTRSLRWVRSYLRLQTGHPHQNTGETGILANCRKKTFRLATDASEVSIPKALAEGNVTQGTLSRDKIPERVSRRIQATCVALATVPKKISLPAWRGIDW
jgi:hypothetical protein